MPTSAGSGAARRRGPSRDWRRVGLCLSPSSREEGRFGVRRVFSDSDLRRVAVSLGASMGCMFGKRATGQSLRPIGPPLTIAEVADGLVELKHSPTADCFELFESEAMDVGYVITASVGREVAVAPRTAGSLQNDVSVALAERLAEAVAPLVGSLAYAAVSQVEAGYELAAMMTMDVMDREFLWSHPGRRRPSLDDALGGIWDDPYWQGLPDVCWKQWIPDITPRVEAPEAHWRTTPPLAELTLGTARDWFDAPDPESLRDEWRSRLRVIMAPLPPAGHV